MFLSDEDLFQLTKKKQRAAQARVLDALGLKYGMRGDKSIVVLQAAVDAMLNPTGKKKVAEPEPNWEAVR